MCDDVTIGISRRWGCPSFLQSLPYIHVTKQNSKKMETRTLLNLIENFDFKGVSFVGIKGYCSDKSGNSEVADVVINIGASYENMKKADLLTLATANKTPKKYVTENFGLELITQALKEKMQSIIAPSEARSTAQKEAYIYLNEAGTLRYCKETGSVNISGVVIKKTVIVAGEYKSVNSKPLTLAKKHLDKVLDLKLAKIRYYKITNIVAKVKVNGETIEIE